MVQLPAENSESANKPLTIFSTNCKRIYSNTSCDCVFCLRVLYYYLCLYDNKSPCYNKDKFQSFKKFCKHLEDIHKIKTPYGPWEGYPKACSKIAKPFFYTVAEETWIPCSKK